MTKFETEIQIIPLTNNERMLHVLATVVGDKVNYKVASIS